MKIAVFCLAFAVWTIVAVFDRSNDASAESPETASLTDVVFLGLRPVTELKASDNPDGPDKCARAYLAAVPQDSLLWRPNPPLNAEEAVNVRRQNLVEQMVTILGERTRSEAKSFATALPLTAEWEGMSEGPVGEADFAGQWLAKRPDTVIAPFLHLFMAHRLRAGYEAAQAGYEKGLWQTFERRYHDALRKARSSGIGLVSCIADDMEAQAFVYLKGQGRP